MEPPETNRRDVRAALQMALTANINRAADQAPYEPADFMPQWGSDPDSSLDDDWDYLTDEQQESLIRSQALEDKVRALNAAFGGKDLTQ